MSPVTKTSSKKSELDIEMADILSNYGLDMVKEHFKEKNLIGDTESQDEPDTLTIEEAITQFFQSHKYTVHINEASRKTYLSEINSLKRELYHDLNKPITDLLEPTFIAEFLSKQENVHTRNKRAAVLRTFIKQVLPTIVRDNPNFFKLLAFQSPKEQVPKSLQRVEVQELIYLAKESTNLRNYTILCTLLGSGIRISELLNLKIGDVNPANQTLKVIPKGNKGEKGIRKINQKALKVLMNYINFTTDHLQDNEDLYIFPKTYNLKKDKGKGPRPLDARTVQLFVKNLVKQSETIDQTRKEHITPHCFRHTFAVHALESGVDIYTIQKLLGHKSIESTEVYLQLFDEQLSNAIEKHPFASFDVANFN